jgi:DHA1 family bicyclomycin/chloramphenicol resistance-like MFS transporter
MPQYKLNVKPPNIVSLIILSAFASMGAVLVTPALPTIAHYFSITEGHAQLTVTSFLLGYAFGQLIYGPLANRLGRKPTFYIGITVATIGSLFSILSAPTDSFTLLVFGRILEALGSSVGLVVCFTIINDFYFPTEARKMIGFMSFAFSIVPGIAIASGGAITEYLNWQMCFYFLLTYGILLILPAVTLPETITTYDPHALHGPYLVRSYMKMFRNRHLMLFSLIYGMTAAGLYVFCAEGPIIGIHLLHYEPSTYGFVGLIPYSGSIVGSIMSIYLAKQWSSMKMIRLGMLCEMLAAALMLMSFLSGWISITSLIAPMVIFMVGHSILVINASSLAINQSEDKANASAVVSFVAVGTGVVGTFILSHVHTGSALVLPFMLVAILILMGVLYFTQTKHFS